MDEKAEIKFPWELDIIPMSIVEKINRRIKWTEDSIKLHECYYCSKKINDFHPEDIDENTTVFNYSDNWHSKECVLCDGLYGPRLVCIGCQKRISEDGPAMIRPR